MNWAILTKPLVITACGPDEIHAAPTKPPISAWDDDVGSPSHQVMRFQITAPRTTPKTAKAAKLKNPAHTTAIRGDSTRVLTTVAIELAASWKPLMKSKASAVRMVIQT